MQYNLFDTKVHNYNPMRDLVEAQKLAQGIQPQVPLLQDVQAPIDVSFGETLSSSLGYTYSPIIDFISNTIKFGEEDRDQNYNPFDDMKGFEGYEDTLKDAVNEEHMNVLKQQLRENIARRNVLANASIGKQIVAGIFDPLNLVALPFGGIGKTVLTSAGRTGASVGVFSAGVEAIRFPFDPLATPDEVAGNIAIATIGGAILGGAIGTVNKVRLRNAKKEIERETRAIINYNTEQLHNIISEMPDKILKSITSSTNTKKGALGELIGYLELRASYDRIIPLGNIVDFIGIKFKTKDEEGCVDFIDIKTGKSARLSKDQKELQFLIENKSINFLKIKVESETIT